MYTVRFDRQLPELQLRGTLRLLIQTFRKRGFTAMIRCRETLYRKRLCTVIEFKTIRLRKAKAYCGQHPGPCAVPLARGKKKPKSYLLEWDDWVKFHEQVNNVLDMVDGVVADVWTLPRDVDGRFWIRRDGQRRFRYDWAETIVQGRSVRLWNPGTADQFQKESTCPM